jgi:aminoglycoside phosphotransferase (APT) family kinase protein
MDTSVLRDRLQIFLNEQGVTGEVGPLEPIVGGFSQITYGFDVETAEGGRRLVLRLDRPGGAALTATDRGLEFRVIKSLNAMGAPVPAAHWADDGSQLGTPALISDFVAGQNVLQVARSGARDLAELADLATDAAATIHRLDTSGLPAELRPTALDWNGYIDEQIAAWRAMEARQAERMPVVRYLASWLDANRPAPVELGLVHGEFSLANLMLSPDDAISVIDWEYAHIGDQRMDFGWCIQRHRKEPPDVLGEHLDRVCSRYRELTGMSEEQMNPEVVSYFVILSGWRAFGAVLDGITRFVNGENSLLLSAYLISPWSLACSEWLQITESQKSVSRVKAGSRS